MDASRICELIYMATLDYLVANGNLKKHQSFLERDVFPDRHVYIASEAKIWMAVTSGLLIRERGRTLFHHEQVEQIPHEFIIGRPLAYDLQRKKLDPVIQHVRELKTPDVRLFGWFARKKHFVLVCGEMKRNLRQKRLYDPYINKVVVFRQNLDLDEPRAVMGVTAESVL